MGIPRRTARAAIPRVRWCTEYSIHGRAFGSGRGGVQQFDVHLLMLRVLKRTALDQLRSLCQLC
ncbi:MAG: hypothetical protein WCL36_07380, partial [bacterium]